MFLVRLLLLSVTFNCCIFQEGFPRPSAELLLFTVCPEWDECFQGLSSLFCLLLNRLPLAGDLEIFWTYKVEGTMS